MFLLYVIEENIFKIALVLDLLLLAKNLKM